jgi:small conductance mechanosensitive channel|tara:strand:- start:1326 stop:2141 length:816 start_codon:yes stop_codon:yes gene_type:complete
MESLTNWIANNGIDWGIKVSIVIAIFIIGKIIARVLSNLLKKVLIQSGTDSMLVEFLGRIAYGLLIIVVALAAGDSLGLNVTSLIAVLGAVSLAVGLALKDSLSNFAAGVMIIIFRPFKMGDFVTAGGAAGVIDEIGLFATLMHTGDNQRIIIPNSAILSGIIINTSALPTRRIDLVIGIGYDENIGQARDIIMAILVSNVLIMKDPTPSVSVSELGHSSVNLNVRPWVNSTDYWTVRAELLESIKGKLDEAGIKIPYPQQDIHIHQVKTE